MYRKTYMEINIDNIKYNINQIINKFSSYTYYFGMMKANAYGHGDLLMGKYIVDWGVNYLVVSSLDEALRVRSVVEVPILSLEVIAPENVNIASDNNITITIDSAKHLKKIIKFLETKIKVHIKIDSGMNRVGIKRNREFKEVIDICINNKYIVLEGLYTHQSYANSKDNFYYEKQLDNFEKIVKDVDLSIFKIIHMANSSTILKYDEDDRFNGIRFGINMYGVNPLEEENIYLDLKQTTKLIASIDSIKEVNNGEWVGYGATYKPNKKELIGIVSIGYADGVLKKNQGRKVEINNKLYEIVGRISMDKLMVKVDDTIKEGDQVIIFGNSIDISNMAEELDTSAYEIFCLISERVTRRYVSNNEIIEVNDKFC